MSDLFGNHIVGFSTRRHNIHRFFDLSVYNIVTFQAPELPPEPGLNFAAFQD